MSRYTMQLRAVEQLYGHETLVSWFSDYELSDYLNAEQLSLIAERLPNWSKTKLAEKCINKYYMREIGFETPYLFKHFLKVRLDEIMQIKLPYLYSLAIEYDPLVNVDYKESYTKNVEGTNTGTNANQESVAEDSTNSGNSSANSSSNTSSSHLEVDSDTPQGEISKANILAGSYASKTNAGESDTDTTSNTSAEDTTTLDRDITRNQNGTYNQSDTKEETFTRTMRGNSGVMTTAQKLIQQYREIQIAIDKEIIDELDNLFFGILN